MLMTRLVFHVVTLAILLHGTACVRRARDVKVVGDSDRQVAPGTNDQNKNQVGGGVDVKSGSGGDATMTTEISRKSLYEAAPTINFDKLTYKMTYASKSWNDKITFDANRDKTNIAIKGIPANVTSDLIFEIYEDTALRFKGESLAYKLNPGANALTIRLTTVNGVGTADVSITVVIANPTPPTATPTPTPTVTPTATPTPTPTPTQTPPPFNWDGKSFQGNAKWKIEVVP